MGEIEPPLGSTTGWRAQYFEPVRLRSSPDLLHIGRGRWWESSCLRRLSSSADEALVRRFGEDEKPRGL